MHLSTLTGFFTQLGDWFFKTGFASQVIPPFLADWFVNGLSILAACAVLAITLKVIKTIFGGIFV